MAKAKCTWHIPPRPFTSLWCRTTFEQGQSLYIHLLHHFLTIVLDPQRPMPFSLPWTWQCRLRLSFPSPPTNWSPYAPASPSPHTTPDTSSEPVCSFSILQALKSSTQATIPEKKIGTLWRLNYHQYGRTYSSLKAPMASRVENQGTRRRHGSLVSCTPLSGEEGMSFSLLLRWAVRRNYCWCWTNIGRNTLIFITCRSIMRRVSRGSAWPSIKHTSTRWTPTFGQGSHDGIIPLSSSVFTRFTDLISTLLKDDNLDTFHMSHKRGDGRRR